MKKITTFIRSLLFSIFTLSTSIPLSIAFIIFYFPFFPNRRKNFDLISAYWCKFTLWILKITTGITCKIEGLENFEKNKSYIIVGKHESTWDTLIMHTFMRPVPVYILKRELLMVPFFGWVLNLSSRIAINRNGGAKTIKQIVKEGNFYLKEGHNLVIFPQGTRVHIDSTTSDYPYKSGFVALIKNLKVDVIPMSLNSGKYWSKKQFLKQKGVITMEYMKPIKYNELKNLTKEEIILKLENIIETKSQELNKL